MAKEKELKVIEEPVKGEEKEEIVEPAEDFSADQEDEKEKDSKK